MLINRKKATCCYSECTQMAPSTEWGSSRICTRALYYFTIIYVNDLEENISSKILKFADDTKMYREISCDIERDLFQEDIFSLAKWSDKWKMEFKINKCKVMHLGASNQKYKYHLNNEQLITTQKERNLGVIINETLKPAEHICRCVKTANQVLGMINII